MLDIKLKATNEQTRKEPKIQTDNSMTLIFSKTESIAQFYILYLKLYSK